MIRVIYVANWRRMGCGNQKWKGQGLFLSGMWGRVRACVPCSVCMCVHICVRLQLGYTGKTVCQLSIAVLAMVFSSQAFSTHNLTKNRCHLTEDQNSVSVTYTPGTDGLCCLLMISEHNSDLFCKSEIRQPSS